MSNSALCLECNRTLSWIVEVEVSRDDGHIITVTVAWNSTPLPVVSYYCMHNNNIKYNSTTTNRNNNSHVGMLEHLTSQQKGDFVGRNGRTLKELEDHSQGV